MPRFEEGLPTLDTLRGLGIFLGGSVGFVVAGCLLVAAIHFTAQATREPNHSYEQYKITTYVKSSAPAATP